MMVKVIIYGRDSCKFCNKAKKLAQFCKENLEGFEYEIDYNEGKGWQAAELAEKFDNPDIKSVPQIFADGRYIGGYTEFDLWLKNQATRGRLEFKYKSKKEECKNGCISAKEKCG